MRFRRDAGRGRFHAEFKKLQTELTVLQDKVNAVQGSVFKGNEKMDQFKLQMNWNQEELEQWALAARQKEEDNLALLKYTKADEEKKEEWEEGVAWRMEGRGGWRWSSSRRRSRRKRMIRRRRIGGL